jgi:AraC-like DNA-binding protein
MATTVDSAGVWRGRLFIGDGTILFVGPGGSADEHSHHAVQLVWGRDDMVSITVGATQRRRAVLIPARVPHAFNASGQQVAILLVESHGSRGAALDLRAREAKGTEVAADLALMEFPTVELAAHEAARWCDAALRALGVDQPRTPLSSVSRRAIAYVERAIDGKPQLAEAARSIGVSATRLTHVFSKEVGIPFRRFVLWARIKRAVAATRAGDDLTRAAAAAGFSDSAHLSRTFRAMFGLSPSLVLPVAEILAMEAQEP